MNSIMKKVMQLMSLKIDREIVLYITHSILTSSREEYRYIVEFLKAKLESQYNFHGGLSLKTTYTVFGFIHFSFYTVLFPIIV